MKRLHFRMISILLILALATGSLALSEGQSYITLRYGMKDTDSATVQAVKALQNRLKELGYMKQSTPSTGGYWGETAAAVAAFQQAAGLPVDGKVASVETLQALFAADAPVHSSTTTPIGPSEPVSTGYSDIKYKDRGAQVAAMQRRLIELGYLHDVADGIYGANTARAVAAFQQAAGLTVNGNLASAAMLALLYGAGTATATPAPTATPVPTTGVIPGTVITSDGSLVYLPIRYGDRGEAVRNMQHKLLVLGYTDDMPDGDFGPKTAAALAAFQAAANYPVDNKLASSELLAFLYSADAPFFHPTTVPGTVTPRPTPSGTYTPPQNYTELKYGTKNSSGVRKMQDRLRELGYFSGNSTGNYYDETAAAVKKFYHAIQGDSYHKVGQVASATMLRALYSVGAPTYAEYLSRQDNPPASVGGYTDLKYGDSGDAVTRAQEQMRKHSVFILPGVTGQYDYGTVLAVAEFQIYFGYPVNGTVLTAEQQKLLFSSDSILDLVKIRQEEGAIPTPTPAPW